VTGGPDSCEPCPGTRSRWCTAATTSATAVRSTASCWIYLTDVDEYARSAEIGYGVRPHAHGQGFATEALVAVSRWALTAGGLQRTWLSINTDNLASMRVAQKAAFTLEGILRRASLEEDGLHDVAVLALIDDEI